MKKATGWLVCAIFVAMLVGGCSTVRTATNPRLVEYRAHAGAPVSSFRYLGQFDSWEPLGDEALAVWTHPREAWLLELSGPCNGLDFTPFIGLTSQMGHVQAGFDRVLVRDSPMPNMPCYIHTIRPLDTAAIRQIEQQQRKDAKPSADGDH